MRATRRTTLAATVCAASLAGLCLGTPALASGQAGAPPSARSDTSALAAVLYGVDQTSHTDVWAVGELRQSDLRPLIEHSDGTAWSRVAISGTAARRTATLQSVSARTASDAWAVGYYWTAAGVGKTMVLHWNGSTWAQMVSPNPGTELNMLLSVSAVSATDAWAVGIYGDGTTNQPLVLHWDGTTWTPVPVPAPGGVNGTWPNGVVAISPTDAWMVGYYGDTDSSSRALIEHWDGTLWTVVPNPNLAGIQDTLTSVTAVSATDAWAVGGYSPTGDDTNTLTEHWNGTTWTKVASPNPTGSNWLSGVSASATNQVWAVGQAGGTKYAATLALRWNGTAWTRVATPNLGTDKGDQNQLLGVVTRTTKDANAVGDFYNGDTEVFAQMIEHWNGTRWVLN